MQTVLSHTNQSFLGELTPSNQAGDWCSTCLFGFQGQEKDNEWTGQQGSHLAFKYRIHDARIGRFLSIDPLTAKYPFYSPYAFSGNRVIDMIELEGLEPTLPQYQWSQSKGYKDYGDYYNTGGNSGLMKVQNYYVIWQYANQEGDVVHKFYNNENKNWEKFTPNTPTSLSNELRDIGHEAIDQTIYYGKPAAMIVGGIVAVAAAIPTGGASLTTLGAFATGLGITSGLYSSVKGATELTLKLDGQDELVDKIPEGGYLNATIGMTVKQTVDNEEVTKYVEFGLNVVEGAATFKFNTPSDLQKFNNLITTGNIAVESCKILDNKEEDKDE